MSASSLSVASQNLFTSRICLFFRGSVNFRRVYALGDCKSIYFICHFRFSLFDFEHANSVKFSRKNTFTDAFGNFERLFFKKNLHLFGEVSSRFFFWEINWCFATRFLLVNRLLSRNKSLHFFFIVCFNRQNSVFFKILIFSEMFEAFSSKYLKIIIRKRFFF